MKKLVKNSILLSCGIALLTACGPLKELSEMHDSTAQMNATTSQMNDTMSKMADSLQTTNTSLQTTNGNIGDMKTQLGATNDKLDITNSGLKDMKGQLGQTNQKLDTTNSGLNDMKTELGETNNKLDNTNSGLMDMKGQLKTTNSGLSKMQDTLVLTHSDLRMIFTAQHREQALQEMDAVSDQSAKMGYAAEYMTCQTFQAWDAGTDTVEYRKQLIDLAFPDFFYKLSEYITDRKDVDPTHLTSKSKDLYAMSAALDYTNMIEADGIKGSKEKLESMMSLIEEGLQTRASVTSGKVKFASLPYYQQQVLSFDQDAIYLLQVRQNFLRATAFTYLSSKPIGDAQNLLVSFYDAFRARFGDKQWNVDLNDKGIAELELLATILDDAIQTEKFLIGIQVKPVIDKNVNALMQNANLPSLKGKGASEALTHFNAAFTNLNNLDGANN